MKNESGFTLIEIIVSLVLVGMMAAIAGMGIVTGTKGYMLAKENSHMAQKAQLAMARIQRELMELTDIAAKNDIQPFIIYDNTSGRHAIARDATDTTIIKMYNLTAGATSLPPNEGDILVDNVHNFTLDYFQGSIDWNFGNDINLLSAIQTDLVLGRSDGSGDAVTFSITVNPRNTKNYGGEPPTATPSTAHNYSCFVATAAEGDGSLSTVLLFGLSIVAVVILNLFFLTQRHKGTNPASLKLRRARGLEVGRLGDNRGNVLIGLIVTMMIFAALGAGMVAMTGTSTSSQVTANTTSKAYYLAESGFRYAASEYLNEVDTDGDGAIEDDRNRVLEETLDGSEFILSNTDERFSLDVYPYYFITTGTYGIGSASIQTKFAGQKLDDFVMPATDGKLKIGYTIYEYSTYVEATGNFTFKAPTPDLQEAVRDHMNVLPVGTAESTDEDDLTLANSDGLFFPTKNGKFMLSSGIVYAYKERIGNTLTTITEANDLDTVLTSLPVEAGDNVILKPFLEVHSTGTVGTGDEKASRQIIYNVPIPDSPTEGEKVEFRDRFNASSAGNWNTISGDHEYSSALKVAGTDQEAGGIEKSLIGLRRSETDKKINLEYAHRVSGYFLSYDAQVKVWFDPSVPDDYAAGLSFRLDQSPSSNSYNSYGVSFIEADSSGSAIDNDLDSNNDIIPEINNANIYDIPMIVLWQQIDSVAGMTRKWLAYTFGTEVPMEGVWTGDIPPWGSSNDVRDPPGTCWTVSPAIGVDSSLETPSVNLSGAPSAVLTFWHKYEFNGGDSMGVYIDNVEIPYPPFSSGPHDWRKEAIPIPAADIDDDVKIEFRMTKNVAGTCNWYIDDVTIHRGFLVNDSTLLVRIKEGATVEFDNGATAVEDGDTLTHANGALGVVVGEPIIDATDDAKGIIILNKLSGPDFQGGLLSVAGKGVVTRCTGYYSRHNYIKVFYGDTTVVSSGNSDPFDDLKKRNVRNETYLHWPPDELEKVLPAEWPPGPDGISTAYYDYFTLVKWHEVNAGVLSVKVVPSKYEPGVIIQSRQNELFTPHSSPLLTARPELGLHTFGSVFNNAYFDDFGLLVEIAAGSGFLTPIQE